MRTRALFALRLAVNMLSSTAALAYSAFVLKGNANAVIGFNENWTYLPGMVVVNNRGIRKYNLNWKRMVEARRSKAELAWISKYGSVTTTAFGLDLPCYGINERGLFVVELALPKTLLKPDAGRPNNFFGTADPITAR